MDNIEKIITNQKYLEKKSSSSYISKLQNMENILLEKAKKRKSKKVKIYGAIFLLIVIVVFLTVKNYNETKEEERIKQLKLEKLEQKKLEQAKIEKENRVREEKLRKEKNFKRVKNNIFIEDLLKDFKNKQTKELKSKILNTNKEDEYLNLFRNNLIDFETNMKSKIKTICKTEANNEKEAIPFCLDNNNKKLQEFLIQENSNIASIIKKSINDLEISNRNKTLDTYIQVLNTDLIKNQKLIKKSKIKFDDYMINGKKVPVNLEKEIDTYEYKIKNINHKINYYENLKKTTNLEIVKPKDLVKTNVSYKSEKKVNNSTEIKKTIKIEKPLEKISSEKLDVSKRIKILQEKIDDAFINGKNPNPELIKELEKLKKQQ